MKLYLQILFTLFLNISLNAQTISKCDCGAVIDPIFTNKIPLYDRPGGTILKVYKNDPRNEDFLVLSIQKDSASFFKVSISNADSEDNAKTGWIKKNSRIGTYARNYSPNDTLSLYSKPTLNSKVQTYIPTWLNYLYTIVECNGKWVYVRVKYKGRFKSGWLAPDKQCDNPYTTCN